MSECIKPPPGKRVLASDQIIIELADALSRCRPLTERESRFLERAIRRDSLRTGRQTKPWTKQQDRRLKALIRSKRPAQIALVMGRTPRAIYRRMYKLGLHCSERRESFNGSHMPEEVCLGHG